MFKVHFQVNGPQGASLNPFSCPPGAFVPRSRATFIFLAALPGVGLAPAEVLAQRPLHGVVADQATLALVDSARVTVVGTELEAVTGGDGTFSFEGVPLGALAVRIEAPGYPVVVEQVEVVRDVVLYMQVMMPRADAVLGELLAPSAAMNEAKDRGRTRGPQGPGHEPELREPRVEHESGAPARHRNLRARW